MQPRRKILAIAEAANPDWVSVPLIGWSLSQALKAHCDVHLVTQIRNRDAILAAGLIEGQDVSFIDSEAVARPLWALGEKLRMGEGKGWTTLQLINAISYPHFERLIWRQFGDALREGQYDLVHRITPLSPTISSPLAAKCARAGVPFVLGPLNGGVPWPKEFDAERRKEKEWLSYLRGAYKALPGRTRSLRHASAIIAGSRHTASEIPSNLAERRFYLPENAVDLSKFPARSGARADGPLRAVFIGRMVPYKGPDMLIEAAAPLLASGQLQIEMIGDGPILPNLKALADRLGVAEAVNFHGWMAHGDVQKVAGQTDLLAFPSIREFGGGVVLEAMAMGLPSLIVDYAGPAELLTDGTGWKVPMGSRDQIIKGFRTKLTELASAPQNLAAAGHLARQRVERDFTWAQKAAQISQIYEWVLAGGGAKPVLLSDDHREGAHAAE